MVNNNNSETCSNEGSGSNFNWKWLCRYTEKNHEHNRFVWYVLVIIVLLDLYAGLILLDFMLKQLILVVISSQHIFQICVGRLLSSYWLLLYDLKLCHRYNNKPTKYQLFSFCWWFSFIFVLLFITIKSSNVWCFMVNCGESVSVAISHYNPFTIVAKVKLWCYCGFKIDAIGKQLKNCTSQFLAVFIQKYSIFINL